jgi:hypothetical protein
VTPRRLALVLAIALLAAILLGVSWWTTSRDSAPPARPARAAAIEPAQPDAPVEPRSALAVREAAGAPSNPTADLFPASSEPARVLRGRVRDPRGASIAGVEIAWRVDAERFVDELVRTGRVALEEEGALEIALIDVDRDWDDVTLELRLDDARTGTFAVPDGPPRGVTELGDLWLDDLPLLVAGSVVDAAGGPVRGAFVSARPAGADAVQVATDANGRFATFAAAAANEVSVTAAKQGARSGAPVIAERGSGDVLLVLRRDGMLSGTVLHGCAAPPANLQVAVRALAPDGDHLADTVGRDGAVLFRRVRPGRYDVAVLLAGASAPLAIAPGIEVRDGERTTLAPFDVRGLLREVTVRVTADDLRAPVAQLDYRPSGSDADWASVPAIGTARIVTTAPALDLVASAPGYVAAERTEAIGTVTLHLRRGLPITLRLREPEVLKWTDVGLTIARDGAALWSGRKLKSAGGLELHVPGPGRYTVIAELVWMDPEHARRVRELVEGEGTPVGDHDALMEILAGAEPGNVKRTLEIDVLDTRAGQTFWIDVPPEVPHRVAAPAER